MSSIKAEDETNTAAAAAAANARQTASDDGTPAQNVPEGDHAIMCGPPGNTWPATKMLTGAGKRFRFPTPVRAEMVRIIREKLKESGDEAGWIHKCVEAILEYHCIQDFKGPESYIAVWREKVERFCYNHCSQERRVQQGGKLLGSPGDASDERKPTLPFLTNGYTSDGTDPAEGSPSSMPKRMPVRRRRRTNPGIIIPPDSDGEDHPNGANGINGLSIARANVDTTPGTSKTTEEAGWETADEGRKAEKETPSVMPMRATSSPFEYPAGSLSTDLYIITTTYQTPHNWSQELAPTIQSAEQKASASIYRALVGKWLNEQQHDDVDARPRVTLGNTELRIENSGSLREILASQQGIVLRMGGCVLWRREEIGRSKTGGELRKVVWWFGNEDTGEAITVRVSNHPSPLPPAKSSKRPSTAVDASTPPVSPSKRAKLSPTTLASELESCITTLPPQSLISIFEKSTAEMFARQSDLRDLASKTVLRHIDALVGSGEMQVDGQGLGTAAGQIQAEAGGEAPEKSGES